MANGFITAEDVAGMTDDEFDSMIERVARESRAAQGLAPTIQSPAFYELVDGILEKYRPLNVTPK